MTAEMPSPRQMRRRAREVRMEIESEPVGTPPRVTGCRREGCPGELYERCYLPPSRCGHTPQEDR